MRNSKKTASNVNNSSVKANGGAVKTPNQLKRYFEKIVELHNSGIEYPINLDEVWNLAYSRRDNAIRALGSDFIEKEDFILLLQNEEQTKQPLRKNEERLFKETKGGGHNKVVYKLSLSCFEYFIAKKYVPCLRFIANFSTKKPMKTNK